MKKFTSWFLVVATIIGFCVSGTSPAYANNINNDSSNDNYSSDWTLWSAGASKYGAGNPKKRQMQGYGCRMVAQAKLLVETGIETSDESEFNPDRYYEWCRDNGYVDSGMRETHSAGSSVVAYAATKDKTLICNGSVKLSGSMAEKGQLILDYLNSGYYVILTRTNHWAYVGRSASINEEKPIIYNSWSSWSYNKSTIQDFYKEGSLYTGLLIFCVDSSPNLNVSKVSDVSVVFSEATNNKYTSKAFVAETNACLVKKVTKTSGLKISNCGMELYENDILVASCRQNSNTKASTTNYHMWYDINDEVDYTLTPGTTYMYRFYAENNGVKYYSNTYSFTSKGSKNDCNVSFLSPSCETNINSTESVFFNVTVDLSGGHGASAAGMVLYNEGTKVASCRISNRYSPDTCFQLSFNSETDMEYRLSEGTAYTYRFYIETEATTYWSDYFNFETNAPTPPPEPTACASHVAGTFVRTGTVHPHYTYYICKNCGAEFTDGSTEYDDSCSICNPWITMYVDHTNGLNLNPQPKAGNYILEMNHGDAVTVYLNKCTGNWYYVDYNGTKGYCYGPYLSNSKPSTEKTKIMYVDHAAGLNLNSQPKSGNYILEMNHGDAVTVYIDLCTGNWYYVDYNGTTGYCYGPYLSDSKP